MKKLLSGFVFIAMACAVNAQQAPTIEWAKCFGGSGVDDAHCIQQTFDGGFIVAGASESTDGDISGNIGFGDCWIVKLDSAGNMVWEKSFGGSSSEYINAIEQTSDSGFVFAAISQSNDGDVSGNHTTINNNGDTINTEDYWIVKLDKVGNLVWQKSLGGSRIDRPYSIQQTTDGGFIVAGLSRSYDGDVGGNYSYWYNGAWTHYDDYWIVKLDSAGNIMWEKHLGGVDYDDAYSIKQTADGGFIVAGSSSSNDNDVFGNHGDDDYWIVKLDMAGNIIWQKCLGGTSSEYPTSIQQTSDGGFIVAGASVSNDGDVSGNHGWVDYWVVKLDSLGNIAWQKSLGGYDYDVAQSVQQTSDGGFIVAGGSNSNDGDISGNHGLMDCWIVKLDSSGNLSWQKTLGGSDEDQAGFIQQTTDGGFIVAGTSSSNDDDVSGWHAGYNYNNEPVSDYWVVKLSPDIATGIPSTLTNSISLHPNPVQTQLTINLATPANDATIRVYDVQGRRIFLPASDIRLATSSIQLNTSSLPDGFYTLQIINNKTGESEVGKFVKAD